MKLHILALSCVAFAGCAKEAKEVPAPRPRPVRVIELREIDPVEPLQLTGAVTAWSEQGVAFEVDGRVTWIVESGTIS